MSCEGREIEVTNGIIDVTMWKDGVFQIDVFDTIGQHENTIRMNQEAVERLVDFLVNGVNGEVK